MTLQSIFAGLVRLNKMNVRKCLNLTLSNEITTNEKTVESSLTAQVPQSATMAKECETLKVTVGIRGPTAPRGEGTQTDLKSALLYFVRLVCMCLH